MKHCQCKSSARESRPAEMRDPGALQAAHQRQSPANLGHSEKHQRHILVLQISASWRQTGRCRASALTPIPFPRHRTPDHGVTLFCYEFARTTLLGSKGDRSTTIWNRCTIEPICNFRPNEKAGIPGLRGAYYGRSLARRHISRPGAARPPLLCLSPWSAQLSCKLSVSKLSAL